MAHSLTDSGRGVRALTPCQHKAQRHRPRRDGPAEKNRSAPTKTRAEVRSAVAAAGRTRRAATGSAGRKGGPAREAPLAPPARPAPRPAAPGREQRARWHLRRLRLRGPAGRDAAGAGRGGRPGRGAGACAVARVTGIQHGALRAGLGGVRRSGGRPAALSLTPRPAGERRMNSKGVRGEAAGPARCGGRGQTALPQGWRGPGRR